MNMPAALIRILFVCSANAARSQMAEGFARAWCKPNVCVESAGVRPMQLSSTAVAVMAECGIDLTGQYSKGLDTIAPGVDYMITLCDHAAPFTTHVAPTHETIHWPIPDPAAGGSADPIAAYRAIRTCLGTRVRAFLTEHDLLDEKLDMKERDKPG